MKPEPTVPREGCQMSLAQVLIGLFLIAVVIVMIFPTRGGPREGSKKAKAKQDTLAIVHAVEAYYTEYGQYPELEPGSAFGNKPVDEAAGDPAAGMRLDNAGLFNILR